jgi:phosphoribosylformylglycinamidine synthase
MQGFLQEATSRRLLRSAHDVSAGGVAVALAECCVSGSTGAEMTSAKPSITGWTEQFGEPQSCVVVSCAQERWFDLIALASEHGLVVLAGGVVSGARLQVGSIDLSVDDLRAAYESGLPRALKGVSANA